MERSEPEMTARPRTASASPPAWLVTTLMLALALTLLGSVLPSSAAATNGRWLIQRSLVPDQLQSVCFVDRSYGWVGGTNYADFANVTSPSFSADAILATSDGGQSWQVEHTPPGFGVSAVFFSDRRHGWAAAGGDTAAEILRTTNGGATWQQTAVGGTLALGPTRYANDVMFVNDRQGWVVGGDSEDGRGGVILASSNGGLSFRRQTTVPWALVSVFFTDASHGWAVGDHGTVLATSDGGTHWQAHFLPTNLDCAAVTFSDARHGWIVVNNVRADSRVHLAGAVFATTNGGQSWQRYAVPAGMGPTSVAFSDARHGYIGGLQNVSDSAVTLAQTSDGGRSWHKQSVPTKGDISSLSVVDVSHAWAVGGAGFIADPTAGAYILATSSPARSLRLTVLVVVLIVALAAAAVIVFLYRRGLQRRRGATV